MSDISFFSSKEQKCPVCLNIFKKEIIRQGGGRFIADSLNDDLYRNYKITEKYGRVFPLLYKLIVCPNCYFSVIQSSDMENLSDITIVNIKESQNKREKAVKELFNEMPNMREERDLKRGAAGYFLALSCYSHFFSEMAPTLKKAIISLRISWIFREMILMETNKKEKTFENMEDMYWQYRILARKLYIKAYHKFDNNEEILDNVNSFGPDVDTNYGYDGFLYVMGYLIYEQRNILKDWERKDLLTFAKLEISRSFGIGIASKEKPSILLSHVKSLVFKINDYLKKT